LSFLAWESSEILKAATSIRPYVRHIAIAMETESVRQ
jgi:hypothetical protein